jgi:hypothetical protein
MCQRVLSGRARIYRGPMMMEQSGKGKKMLIGFAGEIIRHFSSSSHQEKITDRGGGRSS